MKNEILFDIMLTILTKKQVTAKALATKYNMSPRSIYRYIDTLSLSIPIATKPGKSGGIYLLNTFSVSSIFFTDEEIRALSNALDKVASPIIKESLLQKISFINSTKN